VCVLCVYMFVYIMYMITVTYLFQLSVLHVHSPRINDDTCMISYLTWYMCLYLFIQIANGYLFINVIM